MGIETATILTLTSAVSGLASGVMKAFGDVKEGEAAEKSYLRRYEIAQENAEIADLEAYEKASQLQRQGVFFNSAMRVKMASSGLAGQSHDIILGQSIAAANRDWLNILESGRKRPIS